MSTEQQCYILTPLALSSLLDAIITRAPSKASPLAVSYPIPVFPPVTTATCYLTTLVSFGIGETGTHFIDTTAIIDNLNDVV